MRRKLSPITVPVLLETPDDFSPLRPAKEEERKQTVRFPSRDKSRLHVKFIFIVGLTHKVNLGGHIPQKAVCPQEATCPFTKVLLHSNRLSVLDRSNRLGAVDVVAHMDPLIVGDFTWVGQLAAQHCCAFLLWLDNWGKKNKKVKNK